MRIKVAAILPALIPSTIIDVVTPLIDLSKEGLIDTRITLERFDVIRDIHWCDIAVLCRNTEPLYSEWLYELVGQNKPFIFDIDDNFFTIDPNTAMGEYHRNANRLSFLRSVMSLAQLVRVYSGPMKLNALKKNANVSLVDAPVDMRLISSFKSHQHTDKVNIVYSTSRNNDELADIFKPALIKLLNRYSDRLRIIFLGYQPTDLQAYPNVFTKPFIPNYRKYLRSFSAAGYDIGLAPLRNDIFHRSKTNNKFREYGASHIAGIYSNVDVYSSCITHNETGLLVRNTTTSWYDAMTSLLEDIDLRSKIQNQAYHFVINKYSQYTFAQVWYQQIQQSLIHFNLERYTTPQALRSLDRIAIGPSSRSRPEPRSGLLAMRSNEGTRLLSRVWSICKNMLLNISKFGISYPFSKVHQYIEIYWTLWAIQFRKL